MYCQEGIKVIKFLDKPECEQTGAKLTFQPQFNNTLSEMTVCLNFKLKFKKPVELINIGNGLQWMKMADFSDKVGFIAFDQMVKMFTWHQKVLCSLVFLLLIRLL